MASYSPFDGPGKAHEVPPPCRDHLAGIGEASSEKKQENLAEPLSGVQGQDPRQCEEAVVLEQTHQPRPLGQIPFPSAGPTRPLPPLPRSPVQDDRTRVHQYPKAGQTDSPAEVQITVSGAEAFVEQSCS